MGSCGNEPRQTEAVLRLLEINNEGEEEEERKRRRRSGPAVLGSSSEAALSRVWGLLSAPLSVPFLPPFCVEGPSQCGPRIVGRRTGIEGTTAQNPCRLSSGESLTNNSLSAVPLGWLSPRYDKHRPCEQMRTPLSQSRDQRWRPHATKEPPRHGEGNEFTERTINSLDTERRPRL